MLVQWTQYGLEQRTTRAICQIQISSVTSWDDWACICNALHFCYFIFHDLPVCWCCLLLWSSAYYHKALRLGSLLPWNNPVWICLLLTSSPPQEQSFCAGHTRPYSLSSLSDHSFISPLTVVEHLICPFRPPILEWNCSLSSHQWYPNCWIHWVLLKPAGWLDTTAPSDMFKVLSVSLFPNSVVSQASFCLHG